VDAVRADLKPKSDEFELLQARVAELEAELLELEASANRAVAQAQERTYWLDRWRIDINVIMDRSATRHVLTAAQRARAVYRTLMRVKRGAT
jgi:hypothetical protein